MANQTATDFGVYPPRQAQIGINFMHTNIVSTISASASDNLYMFLIPQDCFVVDGRMKAAVPTGTTGNIILEVGTVANNTAFGTFTLSGTAVLSTQFPNMISAVTVSSSGTDAFTPVVISVLSAATSTTSVSIYLQLRYVVPGIIN